MGGNGRCVLVVEDDEVVRNVITALLEDEGYRVVTAPNGAAALQHLAQPDAPKPAAILLDMWMPVMDGHEFIAAYRQRPGHHAPIIAMTGALFGTNSQPMPAVDEFLAKPFDVEALLTLLRKHIHTPPTAHAVPA
jgi:CheY-like chemotaxis protein